MGLLIAALPAFLASTVEFVEALTIVLVVGSTRSWRASLFGAGAAALALTAVVVVAGPAVTHVPQNAFRLVVGALLLLFGLRWQRKAILRYAGVVPLHDENVAYRKQQATLQSLPRRRGFDWLGALVSFKATSLEGLEVIFIVLALGAKGGRSLTAAGIGAAAALVLVALAGFAIRRPLAKVPENTMKSFVGGMLCSFGTFWAGEGLGVHWPGDALSLVALLVSTTLLSWIAVRVVRSQAHLARTMEVPA